MTTRDTEWAVDSAFQLRAITGGETRMTVKSDGDVDFAGDVTIAGALTLTGDISVDDLTVTDDLAVTGDVTVGATLGVTGNVAVNTNKFTVAASSGNTVVAGTLGVTGDVAVNTNKFTVAASSGNTVVAGTLGVTGAATLSDALAVTGDITAGGGFRQQVGPAAEALAADQTNNVISIGGVAVGWVAQRAGSIVGISAALSAAVTGAGTTVAVKAAKNGVAIAAMDAISFTADGAEVKAQSTYTKDTHTFAAGDVITFVYTSTTITNTPTIVAFLEIEQ